MFWHRRWALRPPGLYSKTYIFTAVHICSKIRYVYLKDSSCQRELQPQKPLKRSKRILWWNPYCTCCVVNCTHHVGGEQAPPTQDQPLQGAYGRGGIICKVWNYLHGKSETTWLLLLWNCCGYFNIELNYSRFCRLKQIELVVLTTDPDQSYGRINISEKYYCNTVLKMSSF